jgi:hypothetical protein
MSSTERKTTKTNKRLNYQATDQKRGELLEEMYEIECFLDSTDDSKELREMNLRWERLNIELQKL